MLSGYPIFVILLAAVVAPLLAQTRLGSRLPVVVFEVVLGIVIGPHVLQLVADQGFLAAMREVGMVAVLFMAGMEIDFARIRGRPLALGAAGWISSLALGGLAVAVLQPLLGLSLPGMLLIALVTTGLGTLLPILRDGGLLATPFGAMLLAAATVGEVGPIVAASLVLSTRFSLWQEFALLAAFLGMVALAVALGAGLRPPKIIALLARTMHTSTQLPVRLALLLLAGLIFLSQRFGFEAAIGAFAAGMIVGVAARGPDGEDFRKKLDAVCFGWFAPFFFVGTGVAFDLGALGRDSRSMMLVPAFLALFLLTRGLPAWLYRRDLPRGELAPMALSSAVASLGIVVLVANVGLKSGHLSPEVAQALIGAALLSLLVYPTAARALLAGTQRRAGP